MIESRRDFIKKAALISGALGISSIIPPVIQKALAINPSKGSTFLDAEHIVFLMQENRSFDHCFGALKGVRGFNDPRVLSFPGHLPVWFQRDAEGKIFAPFRLDMRGTKATWMSSLPHSWSDQVDAHNAGKMDGWLEAKRSGNKDYEKMPLTMGYYNREDIPFYYALADAFTICDQHFCSSLTGTSPNRSYFWSGTIREKMHADARAHVWNEDIDHPENLIWKTFPERLQAYGIDWKIYQNELSIPVGFSEEEDAFLGNFTDNTLECFKAYNVRVHQAHIAFLSRVKKELEKATAQRNAPLSKDDLLKKQAQLRKVTAALAHIGQRSFESLSPEEKDLHSRAFVTNIKDPYYHRLASFQYEDKGARRDIKIPEGDILHQFREDAYADKLPTVSWLVAPSMFSDHPGAPWFGAWYVSEVMDILIKCPEVWKKTIFILTYDENDGYFDHIPPFVAPDPYDDTTGLVSKGIHRWESEFVSREQAQGRAHWPPSRKRASPIGLGFRVPMIVASPWTRGGYVNSQVFDHTSALQFLEYFLYHKTGKSVIETNITSWRRALCGDLTSIFRPYSSEVDFSLQSVEKTRFIKDIYNAKFKEAPRNFIALDAGKLDAEAKIQSHLPAQEAGVKPSCALPYELYADGCFDAYARKFYIDFKADNQYFGRKAAGSGFKVYAPNPYRKKGQKAYELMQNWSFTVKAGESIRYAWDIQDFSEELYHLCVYGPNGFYRAFQGSKKDPKVKIGLSYQKQASGSELFTGHIVLHMETGDLQDTLFIEVRDHMQTFTIERYQIQPYGKADFVLKKADKHTWYDISVIVPSFPDFRYRFAGRVETGAEGITDPIMAEKTV